MPGILLSINTSRGGVPKLPRHEAHVTTAGVEGDRQRDRRFHGGPERAVCLYSFDRIRALQAEGHPISIGQAGENLTVTGVDWTAVGPGARLTIGGVRLLVTSFTVPCRNLGACFDGGHTARISQKANPGWSRLYACVEQPGFVSIGDPVTFDPAGSSTPDRAPAAGGAADPAATRLSISRTGTLDVACPPARAFVYFTPDGERLWVPGFDPTYLHPRSGEQGPGAIFTTTHGGEDTLWMVVRFSPDEGVAEYARVTPGSRRGTVRVSLEARGDDMTRATVSYDLTALSDAGVGVLASMSETSFAAMLADWARRIADCRR
jgi:MOSC domain-containing protein YiiM